MIIIKVFQGPGNQMFQYAYGLAAAKRVGAELKLDLSWFDSNANHRPYILDRFDIKTSIATVDEIEYIKTLNGQNFLEYRFNILRNMFAPRHKKAVVKEDLSVFDKLILNPHKNSYIEGYFTTEEFFLDYKPELRSSFNFARTMPQNVTEIANSINDNTVAFSIRRGDFLGNELHNICSKEYFERAINRIQDAVEKPELLVFSDDVDWVKTNLKFGVKHQFVEKVDDHMNHMRLMSKCKNHIIPNSTFSWWGAWLSNPKVVIAPQLWLTDNKAVHLREFGHWVETNHTVPQSWIRIPNQLSGEILM